MDVITTPVLADYGVSFNTLYKLLICTSCAEGFPLRSLYNHLKKDGAKRPNWDGALKCWRATEVVYENHPSKRLENRKKFKEKIVKSLISEGHITEEGEIRDAGGPTFWKDLPFPEFTGELPPPVVGLRTFPQAIQCTVEQDDGTKCGYISTAKSSFKNHMNLRHGPGHSQEYRDVVAQTLNESWVEYFEVLPVAPLSMFDQTANPIDTSGFNLEAAHGLLHQTTAAYMNDLNVVPDLDVRTILPVFVETGIDQFIQPFNRKNFRKFFDPDPENAIYAILRHLILETYKEGINVLQQRGSTPSQIPSNIFLLMTNCTP